MRSPLPRAPVVHVEASSSARTEDTKMECAGLEADSPPPPWKCIGLTAHRPSQRHRQYQAYWMFEAAKVGCINCMTQCLNEKQISPYVTSLTEDYTILDYARDERKRGSRRQEMLLRASKPSNR